MLPHITWLGSPIETKETGFVTAANGHVTSSKSHRRISHLPQLPLTPTCASLFSSDSSHRCHQFPGSCHTFEVIGWKGPCLTKICVCSQSRRYFVGECLFVFVFFWRCILFRWLSSVCFLCLPNLYGLFNLILGTLRIEIFASYGY